MKELIIIGARGFGREVYSLAKDCQEARNDFVIKGFLDDNTDALSGMAGYPPILDSVEHYIPTANDLYCRRVENSSAWSTQALSSVRTRRLGKVVLFIGMQSFRAISP